MTFRENDPSSRGGLVNAGIYLASRSLVEEVDSTPCSLESDVFPRLAATRRLKGFEATGYFIDIGLPDSLAQARSELPAILHRGAVFFDRDGVLNFDSGYVSSVDTFRWLPGAKEAVRRVNEAGLRAIVVTNQAGVARGLYTEDDVRSLHRFMSDELAAAGAFVDRFYYCPHHPDALLRAYRADHPERKPHPGMILRAAAELGVDLAASVLIGDKSTDMQAAAAAGVLGLMIRNDDLPRVIDEAFARLGSHSLRRAT